jgi:hypothetical protein
MEIIQIILLTTDQEKKCYIPSRHALKDITLLSALSSSSSPSPPPIFIYYSVFPDTSLLEPAVIPTTQGFNTVIPSLLNAALPACLFSFVKNLLNAFLILLPNILLAP